MRLDSARGLKKEFLDQLMSGGPLVHSEQGAVVASAQLAPGTRPRLPRGGGVAVGIAIRGRNDYAVAVHIQERTAEAARVVEFLNDAAHGETEVQYVGRIGTLHQAHPSTCHPTRPVSAGVSIGHTMVTAGTLGAFVTVEGLEGVHALSNNHILAAGGAGAIGDDIVQPGPVDCELVHLHRIGTLSKVVDLAANPTPNAVDAATCQLDEGVGHVAGDLPPGMVGPVNVEGEGLPVAKIGRTTGRTDGVITDFDFDLVVDYGDPEIGTHRYLRFDGQITVEGPDHDHPFSRGGDSGSLVFCPDPPQAIGLLFAGSETGRRGPVTYVNPLPIVFKRIGGVKLIR